MGEDEFLVVTLFSWWFDDTPQEVIEELTTLARERARARAARDWARADELRNRIIEMGWNVKDMPGKVWLIDSRPWRPQRRRDETTPSTQREP